jgi:ketosteroid isomerase-like protein
MSQENVEVVRRMFERWNAGDGADWLRSWHADAEWISEPFAAKRLFPGRTTRSTTRR